MTYNLAAAAHRERVISSAIGRVTMYPCRGCPSWLDEEARQVGRLDAQGDRLVAFEVPFGAIFVVCVTSIRGSAAWYVGEIKPKHIAAAEHEIAAEDRRRASVEPFCACGRRVSECDRSRAGCRR
jgi:hypothetical protein